jgi:hypothetical protein
MTSCLWRDSDSVVKTAVRCKFSYILQRTSFQKNFHQTMPAMHNLQHSMHAQSKVATLQPRQIFSRRSPAPASRYAPARLQRCLPALSVTQTPMQHVPDEHEPHKAET